MVSRASLKWFSLFYWHNLNVVRAEAHLVVNPELGIAPEAIGILRPVSYPFTQHCWVQVVIETVRTSQSS